MEPLQRQDRLQGGKTVGMLQGKRALVVGVANERSIAWGIAAALRREGAQLAFSYQNERLLKRVRKLAAEAGSELVFPCDVSSDEQIEALFEQLAASFSSLDILVHALAYAPRQLLQGSYLEHLDRDGFLQTQEISAYSLSALAAAARPLMQEQRGALLTLSYLGAERAIPNYNVMGVAKAALEASVRYLAAELGAEGTRVNAISAGPIRTLAASGISGFRDMQEHARTHSPLQRNVTLDDVGNAAGFLCSDYAAAITGQVLYVDCGYAIGGGSAAPRIPPA